MAQERFVADESYSRESASTLLGAGYSGIIGYCSHDSGKNLGKTDIDAYLAAGLDVGLIWETAAQRASSGAAAGSADATELIQQARAVGATGGCLYMCAEDQQPQPQSEWPNIDAYFKAAGPIVRQAGFAIGGYGSQAYLEHAKAAGLVDRQWMVGGWSTSVGGDLMQQSDNPGRSTLDGGVDCNLVVADGDWGSAQFGGSSAASPPSPTPSTDTESASTPQPAQSRHPTLREGDTGPDVIALQRRLAATPDGTFGAQTKAAVEAFQRTRGLQIDGIAGPEVWAALDAEQPST